MAEIFDNDLHNYLTMLDKDEAKVDYTLDCDEWKNSNYCGARIWDDTDVCSRCKEHADFACADCEDYLECNNENKKEW